MSTSVWSISGSLAKINRSFNRLFRLMAITTDNS